VTIVSHPDNRGLGAALRTGFGHATGDWIITTDSDCTYHPRHLPDMIRLMEHGADVVVASPYHPAGGVGNVPAYRIFLSRNLSRLYALVVGRHVYTYTSLCRIYRADLVRALTFNADGFLSMAEILVGTLMAGAKVVEFPTVLNLRQYGESKVAIARLMGQHLRFLTRVLGWRVARIVRGHDIPRPAAHSTAVRRFREIPGGLNLAEWNRRMNRAHGTGVLEDHPNPVVRWHESDRKRRIRRLVRPGPRDVVVDVGCEKGSVVRFASGRCRYAVCVDIDHEVLVAARRRLDGVVAGFVVADAQALPLRTAAVDIAISSHTLEHLPDPAAGLRELRRVTKADGYLVINVPNDRWVLALKRTLFRVFRAARFWGGVSPGLAPGHLWIFDRAMLRHLCRGQVNLGRVSFNIPFFTNIFTVARPLPVSGDHHAKGQDR
jgi:dolichol-phosphate mannosyltransferase